MPFCSVQASLVTKEREHFAFPVFFGLLCACAREAWLYQPFPENADRRSCSMIEMQRSDHSEEDDQAAHRLEITALMPFPVPTIEEADPSRKLPSTKPLSLSGNFSDDRDHQLENLRHARTLLYFSHFFAQFSEGTWQFALILFLAAVSNYQSLLLVSTYGMTSFAAVCLGGSPFGRYVDCANRLTAARRFILTENLGVVLGSLLCYLLLRHIQALPSLEKDAADNTVGNNSTGWENYFRGIPADGLSISLLLGIHTFGPLAQILDHAFLVAIERDWIVVMSSQCPPLEAKEWLSQTNVALKQIDLSCKIVAPAVAGWVVGASNEDLTKAAVLVGIMNVVSLIVEYSCTARIYQLVPALAFRHAELVKGDGAENGDDAGAEWTPMQATTEKHTTRCRMCALPHGLGIYVQQPIAWGGFGLSMLYLNALTFGGLMTAFLVYKGMSVEATGVWRGISSGMGLLGTFVYHDSVKRRTLVQTGQWSIVYLFFCVSLCFGSFFVKGYTISVTMLLVGACCSRIGLWVFDITITQLMQEFIPDGIRGTMGGTQEALNAFFQLLSFSLGLVFPDPGQFYIFCGAGYLSIGIALVLYTVGVTGRASSFVISET